VYFPFDQSVLTPEAQSVVTEAAKYSNDGHATKIVVVGHTDTSGSPNAYNAKLSERRAKAVADAWSRKVSRLASWRRLEGRKRSGRRHRRWCQGTAEPPFDDLDQLLRSNRLKIGRARRKRRALSLWMLPRDTGELSRSD
jgi:carbonic anhydrase